MSALVLGGSYRSTKGRKPSRPSFGFYFHNDAAAGTSVVDRFGNAAALTIQGTLGTAWTASRGFLRPNGTDVQLITGTSDEYAGQTVAADALLTAGKGLIIATRYGYAGTKNTSNEVFFTLGRTTNTTPGISCGTSAGALANFQLRGVNSSATSSVSFGSSGDYSTTADMSLLWHVEATATGVNVNCWKDGVSIGTLQNLLWTANAGTVPSLANFAMPDGITIGALRGGSSGTPTWSQRIGASNSGGTRVAYVVGLNLAAANVGTAAALALEMHQYPRAVGEILGSL